MSLRWRLALTNMGVLALVLTAFSAGVFFFVQGRMSAQLDAQLDRELNTVAELAEHNIAGLKDVEGHGVAARFEVVAGTDVLYRSSAWERSGRVRSREIEIGDKRATATVALDEAPLNAAIRTLAVVLLAMFPAALALSLAGGYLLAGRMLAPVGAMATKAREITAERLSERLPVGDPSDELGRLAVVVNETLSRLQSSFEQLRRFTADASHELRTPLTAIRTTGEVALQSPRDAAFYKDVIGSMLEEVDRLSRLVESLLTLTRADAGTLQAKRERVDLGALAKGAVETLRVLAEEREQKIAVDVDGSPSVSADPAILRQAALNLVDNAIKYTPVKGEIHVSVRTSGRDAVLEVSDSGPGIALEHREKIFERFYRIDPSRSEGGVGLGLAIARWAATVNGGRLELVEGSTFRIVMPVV